MSAGILAVHKNKDLIRALDNNTVTVGLLAQYCDAGYVFSTYFGRKLSGLSNGLPLNIIEIDGYDRVLICQMDVQVTAPPQSDFFGWKVPHKQIVDVFLGVVILNTESGISAPHHQGADSVQHLAVFQNTGIAWVAL